MPNNTLQVRLAELIKNSVEYEDETSDSGWYYIPFITFLVELCQLLRDDDPDFNETEFMASTGFKKVNSWLITPV